MQQREGVDEEVGAEQAGAEGEEEGGRHGQDRQRGRREEGATEALDLVRVVREEALRRVEVRHEDKRLGPLTGFRDEVLGGVAVHE